MRLKGFVFWFGFLLLLNFIKGVKDFAFLTFPFNFKSFYIWGQVLLLLCFFVWLTADIFQNTSYIKYIFKKLESAPVPRSAKIFFLLILFISIIHIYLGRTNYPFENVGMFAGVMQKKNLPEVLVQPRYFYFNDKGTAVLIEPKKYNLLLAGWSFNGIDAEYTSPVLYHYKHKKANFDFLKKIIKEKGVNDTLWVGLHIVDFRTGTVSFNSNIRSSVIYCDSVKPWVTYGTKESIFIPSYQLKLAYESK